MIDDEVDVTEDLKVAVSAIEPERTKLFDSIIDSLRYRENKDRALILKRFIGSAFNIEGLSRVEILNFHARFVDDFWHLLGSEGFELHVQVEISELEDYCDRIATASKETIDEELLLEKHWHMNNAENENRYARYLESALMEFDFSNPNGQSLTNDQPLPDDQPVPDDQPLPHKLSYAQVALIYIFQGRQITKSNGADIAAQYGLKAKSSNQQLYDAYLLYNNKKNEPTTAKGITFRIKLIKSVIPYLPTPEAIQSAENAIKELEQLLLTVKN